MLDQHSRHEDLVPFDGCETFDKVRKDAEENAEDLIARPLEQGADVTARRPRFVCIGFAVIRI